MATMTTTNSQPLPQGITLGRGKYTVEKVLGQGGFGYVYLARDRQGRTCAIKQCTDLSPEGLMQFGHEGAVQKLLDDATFVRVYAQFVEKVTPVQTQPTTESLFTVMEYVPGRSLEELLAERLGQNRGPFAEADATHWITQLLGSLVFWMFAWIGLGLSMFVSRRQEYDADRYSAELAGSDAFFGTSRRMIELMMGESTVMRQGWRAILATLQEHDGVENLTSEIVAGADRAAETSAPTIEKVLQTPTGIFDSHPGMRDRVKAVRQRQQPGLFAVNHPAYALYPRFNPNPQ